MHGMRYPDMMGMDMGFTGIMGMPYGMFKEGDDETAAEQEGSIDAAFVPEGAEIHDQQTPQRRFDLDDIAISDQVKKDSLAGSESVRWKMFGLKIQLL